MSPTSCQTAPPRARSTKKLGRREGKLSHFSPLSVNPNSQLIPRLRQRSRGIRHLVCGSRRAPLQHRLRERAAIDVLELAAHGKAARDARDLESLAREQLADVVRGRLAF